MQNRYVGDVGDFAKYALLRRLSGVAEERRVRIGVVWCLYPDEAHNGDGRHVSYLQRPDFARLDTELLAVLRTLVDSDRRSIAAVTNARILPRGTVYCDAVASLPKSTSSMREDRLRHRSDWLNACFQLTRASDLVFFDPDNGIEVKSVPKHNASSGKYIYWDELEPFWNRGQALLVYHHLNRMASAVRQVGQLTALLQERFNGACVKPLIFRRGSCRVFWLLCPQTPLGGELERRADAFVGGGWSIHFQPFN